MKYQKQMLRKLSLWSCLEIVMQDKITAEKTDNRTFEMFEQFRCWKKSWLIKIPFMKKFRED